MIDRTSSINVNGRRIGTLSHRPIYSVDTTTTAFCESALKAYITIAIRLRRKIDIFIFCLRRIEAGARDAS